MRVGHKDFRTIWRADDHVAVIDQTRLPHAFETLALTSLADAARAIADMVVRGAPLIGAAGAYGVALAMREDASDAGLAAAHDALFATRPTAVNLRWALERMRARLGPLPRSERAEAAFDEAERIAVEDVAICSAIGDYGASLIRDALARSGRDRVTVLTHCNAGWLATVDWGTALAPVYRAHPDRARGAGRGRWPSVRGARADDANDRRGAHRRWRFGAHHDAVTALRPTAVMPGVAGHPRLSGIVERYAEVVDTRAKARA